MSLRRPAARRGMALFCLGLHAVLAAASPASTGPPDEPSPAEQARALLKDGRYEEAAAIARTLLSREEERTGPDTLEVAEAVDLVVEAERLAGRVKDAEVRALAQRAIRIREERLGPDHPDVSRSVNNYANLLAESGDYAGARPLYERVLAIQERKLAPDDLLIAKTLTNLANLVSDMGDYDGSFPLYERALRIKEQALGPDDPQLISTLIGLAILERLTGDYVEARRTCERAVRIAGEKLRPGHPRRGATLATLASIAVEMGDDDEARRLLEQALALQIKELPPEHADIAASYGDLANLRRDAGDLEAARALYEKSLALQTASLEPESAYLVPNLTSLGQVLLALGDRAGAREQLERGLRIRETQLGPEHPDVADSLAALADLLRAEGDLPGARGLLERALRIRERALGPVHPQTAESLARLAGISDGAAAIDLAHRAETIGRAHLRAIARELPERQALRYATARPSGLDVELRVVAERPVEASIRTAWDDLIRGRALVLDEMAARHRDVLASEDRETRALRRRLAAARTQEAALWVRGVEGQDPASYRRVLDQAREREERLERELAEKSLDFRRERHAGDVGLDEVARALPPRSALVAYVRTARPQSAAGPGAARYLAFVLGPSGEAPAVVRLEGADRIDRLVTDWRSAVAAEPSRVSATARDEVRQLRRIGADLRARAWDPVAPRVRGARRVFIVPDGALHLVNFAALPSGADRYLVETAPPLHHLSAESDLVAATKPPGTDRLLVVGGPDFDAARDLRTAANIAASPSGDGRRAAPSPCEEVRDRTFAPLPAAGREAAEIGAVWSRRRSGAADDILSLQGAEATKDRFIQLAPRYQVVHVATHAYFAGEACTSRGGPGSPANPLLLSGLVFAGANRREDSSAGAILTAEELASLDLSRVSWLVLSGCETGVGAIAPGEGVLGLRRAAQIAGARTLIMSLWSTQDEATRRWMSRLYERRLAGASTADAVRKASLDILEARRARGESDRPLYWGAFVAAGDWR